MSNELSDLEIEGLLRKNRGFSGFLVDEHSGPIQSIYQVAAYKTEGQYYSPAWVREENCMDSETISTRYERDSNYVHQGWSLSAISTSSPWISSRITANNRATQEGPWLTQRTVVQRLSVNVPAEDLKPSAEFEADVRAALQKPTKGERFQALYAALNYWGDVVPLVYDLGMSMTVTDLEKNITPENSWLGRNSQMSKTARPNTKGGKAGLNDKGVGNWISQELPPKDWRIVRVTKVIPTLHLLDRELQEQIAGLQSAILLFIPQTLEGATGNHQTWGDNLHVFRTISRVIIRAGSHVDSLRLIYSDYNQSAQHGGSGGAEHIFDLSTGEHIGNVILWQDVESLRAIQFVTTNGRISQHYGSSSGTPTVMSSEGGVLAGFSSRAIVINQKTLVGRIQTIWRHDVLQKLRGRDSPDLMRHIEIIGQAGVQPLNDWAFDNSSTAPWKREPEE